MNLNELRAEDRRELAELLFKLKEKFREKCSLLIQNDIDFIEYFENLGCEIKINGKPFLGSKDFVPIEFSISMRSGNIVVDGKKFPRYDLRGIQLSVPVELAEKVLVLGDLP